MHKNIIEFVQRFTNIKNFKDLLRSIKFEVPKLLDFKSANMYIYDTTQENLKALNLDEDAERLAKKEDPNSFERDFNFDERSVVRFPRNMGISGFAFENDSVTYVNGLGKLLAKNSAPIAHCSAVGQNQMSAVAQRLLFPSPMLVIAAVLLSHIFVASNLPPMPHSKTATSIFCSR